MKMKNFRKEITAYQTENGLVMFPFEFPFPSNLDVVREMHNRGIVSSSDFNLLKSMTSRQRSEGGFVKFKKMPHFNEVKAEMIGVKTPQKVKVIFEGSVSKMTRCRERAINAISIDTVSGMRIPYTKERLNFSTTIVS